MTEPDIRLQVRIRNARVLRAMAAAGVASVADLCRRCGYGNQPSMVGEIINFKRRPVNKDGTWRPIAEAIATALHCEPDHLWPEHLARVEAAKTEVSIDLNVDEFARLSGSGERAFLESDIVSRVLAKLPSRERTIVEMRYGLNGNGEHTLEEVATLFGRSRDRIRQLQERALRRMRKSLGVAA